MDKRLVAAVVLLAALVVVIAYGSFLQRQEAATLDPVARDLFGCPPLPERWAVVARPGVVDARAAYVVAHAGPGLRWDALDYRLFARDDAKLPWMSASVDIASERVVAGSALHEDRNGTPLLVEVGEYLEMADATQHRIELTTPTGTLGGSPRLVLDVEREGAAIRLYAQNPTPVDVGWAPEALALGVYRDDGGDLQPTLVMPNIRERTAGTPVTATLGPLERVLVETVAWPPPGATGPTAPGRYIFALGTRDAGATLCGYEAVQVA